MYVDDPPVQRPHRLERGEAVRQQVSGIEVRPQTAGIETVEELRQDLARFEAGFQGQYRPRSVAVTAYLCKGFGHQARAFDIFLVRNLPGLDDGTARPEVVAERQHVLDVFDAPLQVLRVIEPVPQRAAESGQFEV